MPAGNSEKILIRAGRWQVRYGMIHLRQAFDWAAFFCEPRSSGYHCRNGDSKDAPGTCCHTSTQPANSTLPAAAGPGLHEDLSVLFHQEHIDRCPGMPGRNGGNACQALLVCECSPEDTFPPGSVIRGLNPAPADSFASRHSHASEAVRPRTCLRHCHVPVWHGPPACGYSWPSQKGESRCA